jgi:ATP adenylyltransferase
VSKEILQRLDQLSRAALASGDLLPVQAQEQLMRDQGLAFFVRWVSTLAAKDAASVSIQVDRATPTSILSCRQPPL